MSLDKTTVKKIATLARIDVPDEALDPLAKELSGILDWIEQLSEVDTDGIEPMSGGTDRTLPLRVDEVTDGGYAAKILANATDAEEGFFTVPKVVE